MITEPRNMVIYVAGYPAIMGLQPLYFLDSELARRARIKAKAAHAKKLEDILTPADKTIKRQKRKLSGGETDLTAQSGSLSFSWPIAEWICRPTPWRILPPSGEKRRFSFLITERMRFFSSSSTTFDQPRTVGSLSYRTTKNSKSKSSDRGSITGHYPAALAQRALEESPFRKAKPQKPYTPHQALPDRADRTTGTAALEQNTINSRPRIFSLHNSKFAHVPRNTKNH